MVSARDIKRRIKSVKSTQKITKAMKMVSASKLRRTQTAVTEVRPFAAKIEAVISHLAEGAGDHPFLKPRKEIKRVAYVVIGSDRGLCGGFNVNLHRFLTQALEKEEHEYGLIVLGNKVRDYALRRGYTIDTECSKLGDTPSFFQAREVARLVNDAYVNGEYDEVYVVYTRFKSAMSQEPMMKRLMPVVCDFEESEESGEIANFTFEPSCPEILDTVIPQYVEVGIYSAMQEAKASEHGARMTAMSSATDNATEMIGSLTLSLNRARQAAITTEITEIVSGAAALE